MSGPEMASLIVGFAAAFMCGYTVALWRVDKWLDSNDADRERGFNEDRW